MSNAETIRPDEVIGAEKERKFDAQYDQAKQVLTNTPRRLRRWLARNLRKIGSVVMSMVILALAGWYFYSAFGMLVMTMAAAPVMLWSAVALIAFALLVIVGTFLRLSW